MKHNVNFFLLCINCRVINYNQLLESSLFWINFCDFSFLGSEIINCSVNCGSDTCKKCSNRQVQPFQIQSTTPEEDRKCFDPKGNCNDEGSMYTQNSLNI